jgi:hypothetical protein
MQAVTYHAELLPPSAALNVSPPDRQCVFLNVLPEAAMAANERANESEVARNSPLRRPMHHQAAAAAAMGSRGHRR